MPATVVGLLSFPECVAITYERAGHTQQLCCGCPVEWLTFPIERVESPTSERCLSPPPTTAIGFGGVATDVHNCLETESLSDAPQDDTKHFQVALSFHKTPWATAPSARGGGMVPPPPNIAAYAYQAVHVWSALLTCLRPPCISYALVQATIGVGTVIIVYVI